MQQVQRHYYTWSSPRRPIKRSYNSKLIGRALAVLLVLLFVLASYQMYNTARSVVRDTPDLSLLPSVLKPIVPAETSGYVPPGGKKPAGKEISGIVVSGKKEDLQKPINIVLLGIDKRPGETDPARTDTIIVLHYNPKSHTLGMLSIPRDLWVQIPGDGENRINMAYPLGEIKKYPGGGPALVKETVRRVIGYPIDYHVIINFNGFRRLIDLIGGIDVDVPKPIDDPTYPSDNYGYDPLHIPAGHIHMDGKLALKYARTRHQDSDIGRAHRQQQVILAIRDKVLRSRMLPSLIRRAPQIYQALGDSMSTDLPLSKMISLAQSLSNSNLQIKQAVIDETATKEYKTQGGAWVLLPLRDKIRPLVDSVMGGSPVVAAPAPVTQVPDVSPLEKSAAQVLEERLRVENAHIVVLNGTLRSGLAASTAEGLRKMGFDVMAIGNADRADYSHTVLLVYDQKKATISELKTIFGIKPENIRLGANLKNPADLILILGQDAPSALK